MLNHPDVSLAVGMRVLMLWAAGAAGPPVGGAPAAGGLEMVTFLAYLEPIPGRLYPLVATLQELARRAPSASPPRAAPPRQPTC